MIPRAAIERVKRELAASLEAQSETFHRAILREVEYLWHRARQNGVTFDEFIERFEKLSIIPPSVKFPVLNALRTAEEQVAEIWMEYFDDMLPSGWTSLDLERMHALHQVDFPRINDQARRAIVGEMRRSARTREGFDALRHRLMARNLGEAQASTLANTALAQFDNATMHELSSQAGIEKFLYDGVLHPNSRHFCRERVGRVFTLEHIRRMDNMQGIPVETSLGGYNCTHWWTPVVAEAKKRRPRATQPASQAAGRPVSEALDLRIAGALGSECRRALEMIDVIHGDGDLTRIPIKKNASRRNAGAFYFRAFPKPGPVEIKISSWSTHPVLTTLHEIGHFIDHDGFGRKGEKESRLRQSLMQPVLEAAAHSNEIRRIASTMSYAPRRYYLSPEEVWARAYSQYIVEASGDQTALAELEPLRGNTQWHREDFQPIARAIEDLFIKQGWIKK